MIYDSEGVLLVLVHWRQPGQAKWVPVLDTKTLDRLAGGRKEETYWPVAVAQNKFHCIILKVRIQSIIHDIRKKNINIKTIYLPT